MDVLDLCSGFSLLDGQTQEPPLNKRLLTSFETGETVFGWVHLGVVEVEIDRVIAEIRNHSELCPLRTGHLGNWDNIAERRACAVDYNSIIAADLAVGKACIFDMNMTEADNSVDGDWIYLPGSVVKGSTRQPIMLTGRSGDHLVPLDRNSARYVPLMWMRDDGGILMPLVSYQKNRASLLDDFNFEYQSEFILGEHERVRRILIEAIERICSTPGAATDKMLGLLFDKTVVLDGRMDRLDLVYREGGFLLEDGTRFGSAEALVDAAFAPLLAAADPSRFWADAATTHPRFPMFSGPLIAFFLAALESHLMPGARGRRPAPFTPHVHWGALGMAGYPPYKRGYFSKNVKQSRKIYELLITSGSELPPIYFMLLPSAIFHLYTHQAHPGDKLAIEGLIARVHRETGHLRGKSNLIAATIRNVTEDWVAREGANLSSYLRAKFASRRSVLNDAELPSPGGRLLEPAGFGSLTCLQACMTVGALHEVDWKLLVDANDEPERNSDLND